MKRNIKMMAFNPKLATKKLITKVLAQIHSKGYAPIQDFTAKTWYELDEVINYETKKHIKEAFCYVVYVGKKKAKEVNILKMNFNKYSIDYETTHNKRTVE